MFGLYPMTISHPQSAQPRLKALTSSSSYKPEYIMSFYLFGIVSATMARIKPCFRSAGLYDLFHLIYLA